MAHVLSLADVCFGYRRGSLVLDGFSLDVGAGETVALVGPSGSGKSTALYVAGLLAKPSAGRVCIAGSDVTRTGDRGRSRTRAADIGFVFQTIELDLRRTVLDNVAEGVLYNVAKPWTIAEVRRKATALLEMMEVSIPPDRTPGEVSGGQAQRVAVARALVKEPRVVLADEPTGHLDPDSSAVVLETLGKYASSGAGVLVVTHSEQVAAACDRVVALRPGIDL